MASCSDGRERSGPPPQPAPAASAAQGAAPQPAAPPPLPEDRPGAAGGQPGAGRSVEGQDLVCEMRCSQERPRTSTAIISWALSDEAGAASVLSGNVPNQRLEVTVFKDGFARGNFVALQNVREDASFVRPSAAGTPRMPPGLRGLVVAEVESLQQRLDEGAPGAVEILGAQPPGRDARTVAVVEVEGIEPGLNYFWRLQTPGGARTVRCQAPVCPADRALPR